jgi:hypothetical protein
MTLPVTAQCEDTLSLDHFRKWMIKNIDAWFAFTQYHGLALDMEDIVFVTGCHHTKSWCNVAFTEVDTDAQFTLQVEVTGAPGASINWRASSLQIQGAVLSPGPTGAVSGIRSYIVGHQEVSTCSLRTYLRINAYFSEGFVPNVFSGYFRGSKERQNPSQIHVGTTANKRCKWFRYPVLLR